jgi:chemotaxis response regulator CheB
MAIHILGIRHHGPGSAKNVLAFLEQHQPDIILIEGPPEADALLPFLRNNQVEPPVAILAYQTDNIQQAVYYPFAIFSPEWQAMQYASKANIHARFIDLPLTHWLALSSQNESENSDTNSQQEQTSIHHSSFTSLQKNSTHHLATIAGFTNEESWWEQMFEQRQNNTQVFEAVSA